MDAICRRVFEPTPMMSALDQRGTRFQDFEFLIMHAQDAYLNPAPLG